MEMIVLSIHLLVCICLIGLVLLQRSEGGALGMGGGGGGALMSGRGAADALAKMTSVAGGFFLVTSLSLTVLSGASASTSGHSVFDRLRAPASAPTTTPLAPAPAATTPAEPAPAPATQPADPTEGSITPSTQLASITPGPSQAAAATLPAAPPANQSAARAAPLTPASGTTTTAPARSQPTALNTTTRPPATQRTGTATTQNRQLVLPNTSGAVTGITLEDTQSEPESVDVGNGLEAVRRQTRAGPDQ